MDDGVERDGPPGEAYDEQEFDREKGFDEQFCRTAYRSRECQDTKAVDSVVVSASHNLAKQVAAAIQPPVWAPLGHPRLSYSLSHSVVTCGTGGPTHTAVYPLHDPTKLPAHHYEQYINLPPPTTDPYACRLTAPSKDGDGTNTPTALPFETSRARVVGPQGQRGDLPITNLPERTEILVTTDSRVQCPQCPKTFAHKKHVKRHLLRLECIQIPESDPTCVPSAEIPLHEVMFSNVISRSAPCDEATQPGPGTYPTHRPAGLGWIKVDAATKEVQILRREVELLNQNLLETTVLNNDFKIQNENLRGVNQQTLLRVREYKKLLESLCVVWGIR
ncbi:hypothetical protein McaMca56_001575 [Microsporum canis]